MWMVRIEKFDQFDRTDDARALDMDLDFFGFSNGSFTTNLSYDSAPSVDWACVTISPVACGPDPQKRKIELL